MFSPAWSTQRLLVRDVTADDTDRLLAVFNANAHIGVWDPTFHPIERPEMAALVQESLAQRNARGHIFHMQAICLGSGPTAGNLIGYYHMVMGVPKPYLVYISMFVLDPPVQNQGYGREMLEGFIVQLREHTPYRAAWAEVYLKNWPALRLWAGAGFDRIVEFDGDKVLTPQGNASVILEQALQAHQPCPA